MVTSQETLQNWLIRDKNTSHIYTSALTHHLLKFGEAVTCQTCCNVWKFKKKNAIQSGNLPQAVVTFGMLTYQHVYIDQTYNLWKFGWDEIQLCMKIPEETQ